MIGYIKSFDTNKTVSFKINDNNHLKKYGKILKKVSNLLDINFENEPVYGDSKKYLKTKIKSYGHKINTNIQGLFKNSKRKWII